MFGLFSKKGPRIPPAPRLTPAWDITPRGARSLAERAYSSVHGDLWDSKYTNIRAASISKLSNWLWEVQKNMDFAGKGYRSHISDCDDIARFALALRRMLDLKYSPVAVKQLVDRGGDVLHMDTAWYTDQGWYCIEPQTGEYWPLLNYPNTVLKVFF